MAAEYFINMKTLEPSEKYRLKLLNRLNVDCIYFSGYGDRNIKHLWAGNVPDHVEAMKIIYDSFPDDKKPQWITLDQIKKYETEMGEKIKWK